MNTFCNEPETPSGFPITQGFDGWRKMKIQRVAATRGGSGAVDKDEDTKGKNGGGSNDGGLADLERLGHLERLGDDDLERGGGSNGGGSNDGGLADLERLGDGDLSGGSRAAEAVVAEATTKEVQRRTEKKLEHEGRRRCWAVEMKK
ncbi:hypothetical protein LR48_Vigan01g059300 [Vigna angularis]|uniref:Uncharacterized protein n=1 Tax=Phaseolus angularis TaxID=3914 RepID=A0A0L9TKC6_PHAAN|nr:hypothetical protein LR48_Vigan01g059300 [Vigna angularis]